MLIRKALPGDRDEWLRMRKTLWLDWQPGEFETEIDTFFAQGKILGVDVVFVAVRESGGLGGFIEAAVRPYANGCTASPVGYIEGWYVDPDLRGQGIGASLAHTAEKWAFEQGLTEMASDVEISNETSLKAHESLGYKEKDRVVCFCKKLI